MTIEITQAQQELLLKALVEYRISTADDAENIAELYIIVKKAEDCNITQAIIEADWEKRKWGLYKQLIKQYPSESADVVARMTDEYTYTFRMWWKDEPDQEDEYDEEE